ncbi:MAG: hypothetical protein RR651_11145 [Lysinibacillus sp.]
MITEKVTFVNTRGQSIDLSNRRPFLLQSVDGKGNITATVQTQKAPYQEGATYIDSELEERPLALSININSSSK